MQGKNYKGQYNNFNAILWTFSVVLRAKDVLVKYGNCHEHSHITLVPKKDITCRNIFVQKHSYHVTSLQKAFEPSCILFPIFRAMFFSIFENTSHLHIVFFVTYLQYIEHLIFLHNSQTLVFVFNMIFKAFIRIRKIWREIHLT